MDSSDKSAREMRREAKKTYLEYGKARELYRSDRENPKYARRLEELRARYAELRRRLKELRSGDPDDDGVIPSLPLLESGPVRPFSSVRRQAQVAESSRRPSLLSVAMSLRYVVSVVALLVVGGILFLIGTDRLGFYVVPTSSMEPTLLPDDRLVALSSGFYVRGDVVVVRDPDDPQGYLVKRVVAVSGDDVVVGRGRLVINGMNIQEPYLKEQIEYKLSRYRVAEGEVFLLGDNRNNSHDSHIWKRGVPTSDIMGKVRAIYAPKSRKGTRISYTAAFAGVE